ncbi:ribosome maturation factor RimM [Candidatus Magnetaquicoccus inordinatus]|uniref:ribosome maturation factor RimM n=1 Tax=Candidatus Magnetaquicoccus inordinatus TaxID=2496818 RepID=UPI00102C6AF6|nr:ribosome maturation factor RimM [Candidatus Magnetaquicoccus inordinatus]
MTGNHPEWVSIGRLLGPFGVKGWIRVLSYTDPAEGVLDFDDWWIGKAESGGNPIASQLRQVPLLDGASHTRGIVAQLEGLDTPEKARLWSGLGIWVPRTELPEPEEDAHYWTDLIGCQVVEENGQLLGTVDHLFSTGANDVLVVREANGEERLLPFIREVVIDIQIDQKTITVCLMPGM